MLAVQKTTPFLLQSSDRIGTSFCNTVMYNGPKYSPSELYYPEAEECVLWVRGTGIYERGLTVLKMKRGDASGQELRWQGRVV